MTSADPDGTRSSAWKIAVASFGVMVVVGSMYGLTAVFALLPNGGFASGAPASAALFGAVCVGLAVGTWLCGGLLAKGSPRTIGTAGAVIWASATVLMGRSIAAEAWGLATAGAVLGGVGAGLSYLTVVAIVGAAFPSRPAAAAAIGPLGFALGTASYCVVGATALSNGSSPGDVGNVMAALGGVCLILAVAGLWLPSKPPGPFPRTVDLLSRRDKALLWGLLFVNALPGMLMLSVAIPLYQHYDPRLSYAQISQILAVNMSALIAGGLLSPRLRNKVGLRALFITLLTLRGGLLVILPLTSNVWFLLLVFMVVLFGHGTGFALLPAVTKSKSTTQHFTRNYGTILVSWGVSGAFAVSITLLCWRALGDPGAALLLAGVLALLAAMFLINTKGSRLLQT